MTTVPTGSFQGKHTTDTGTDETYTYQFVLENGSVKLQYWDTAAEPDAWADVTSAQAPNKDDADFNAALGSVIKTYIDANPTAIPSLMEATVTAAATNNTITFDSLPLGYYYITTSAGTMVTIDTTDPTQTVNDKDSVKQPPKEITSITNPDSSVDRSAYSISTTTENGETRQTIGTAQIGDTIGYTGTVYIGQGAINYYYRDKMSDGLTFTSTDLGNITVTLYDVTGYDTTTGEPQYSTTGTTVPQTSTDGTTTYWTPTLGGTDDSYTFQVAFDNDYIATLDVDDKLVISYSATLNSDANMGSTGNQNEAWLAYGNTPEGGSQPETPPSVTTTYTATLTVVKQDSSNAPVAGAQFVLQNKTTASDGSSTDETDKYYKWNPPTGDDPDGYVSWVDLEDATVFESYVETNNGTTTSGVRANIGTDTDPVYLNYFQGLPVGTYSLIETVTPAGYNTAAPVTISVKAVDENTHDPSDIEEGETDPNPTDIWTQTIALTSTVVNEKGSLFPSTGGAGTVALYTIGGILVVGACVLLVTRRKTRS